MSPFSSDFEIGSPDVRNALDRHFTKLRVGLTVSLLAMRNNRQSSRATTAGNTLRSRGLVVFMARCMHVPVSVRRYHTLIELKVEKSGLLTEKFRVITSQPVVCEKA